MKTGDVNVESNIENNIPLALLFPNLNLSYVDLHPYLLYTDTDLVIETSNVLINDCIDEITETSEEIETENEEADHPTRISIILETLETHN